MYFIIFYKEKDISLQLLEIYFFAAIGSKQKESIFSSSLSPAVPILYSIIMILMIFSFVIK